jgi:hypothetical protein
MLTKPEFITFTGADDHTSIEDMRALSSKYPIEWGILFSPKRQGVDPRYPANESLSKLVCSGLRLSAHLCGDYARGIMEGRSFALGMRVFGRVQVNHPEPIPERIAALPARGIAQTRGAFPNDTSVDWLFDASGGRGITPAAWPAHPGRLVGYAGGITLQNVIDVLAAGVGAAVPYWIDMESGVRTDDRFDIEKCRLVCEAVYGAGS